MIKIAHLKRSLSVCHLLCAANSFRNIMVSYELQIWEIDGKMKSSQTNQQRFAYMIIRDKLASHRFGLH